jgi:hypothetical protein
VNASLGDGLKVVQVGLRLAELESAAAQRASLASATRSGATASTSMPMQGDQLATRLTATSGPGGRAHRQLDRCRDLAAGSRRIAGRRGPGDPHPDQPRPSGAGTGPARVSFTRARDGSRSRLSDTGCFPLTAQSTEDLAFEISCRRNPVPEPPGRRYERKTKRPAAGTRLASPARPPG